MHWAGMADFKDRSESYRAFVLAAVERIVALAPEARGHAGEPVWGYLPQIAAFTVPASFLVWLLMEIRSKGGPNYADRVVPLAEKAAEDDRNFVKKGVSWALRRVGHRSASLHAAVLEIARRLEASDVKSARWVGKATIKDLTRPAVVLKTAKR